MNTDIRVKTVEKVSILKTQIEVKAERNNIAGGRNEHLKPKCLFSLRELNTTH